ncbi:choice-of-anchor J domain-containing protein [Flavobacterium hauense]
MNQQFFWGLSENNSGGLLCVCQKLSVRKFFLLLFLSLFSMTGYAQLALQNFESGIPATWAQANNAVGTTAFTISTDGYLSSGAAFIDPSSENIGNGNTAQYYLITPSITVPANGQLRFFTKQSSTTDFGNIYQIRISTASQTDISSFNTLLASWTESELNTVTPLGYEEKVIDLPSNIAPNLNIYVAFVLINNQNGATPNADTWFIDNVSLQTGQICENVLAEDFTASAITPTTATLSWTHPSATQFQIQVLPTGVLPGTTGTVTGNSYSATLLDPATGYDVYIKSICSESTSVWAGPFPFSTPAIGSSCSSAIIIPNTGAPFVYSGNLDNFQNPDITYDTQGSCLPASVSGNYLTGGKAFFTYTPTQDGLITITQVTQDTGWNHITGVFVYDGCTNVGVNCLAGLNTSEANVAKKIPNFLVQAGHTYIIVVSTVFSGESNIHFTLKVETAPCAPPAVFTYKDLIQDSVKLSWNNVGNFASAWQYVVLPAGSPAPTGAGTATTTNIDNLINTGLAAGAAYDFYVRSVCSSVPGPWSDPYTFTTQCTVFNTPYTESFDGAFGTNPTPCWTPLDINGDDTKWKFGWENISLSNQEMASNNDMMVLPMINLGTTPKRLRFKYQTTNGVRRYSVVLSTTGIGPNNFTTVILPTQNVDTNYDQVEKIVNIPTTITGNVNIAFYVDPGVETDYNNLIMDDIVVEDKPACPDPVALNADAITTTTAQLSWEAGDVETQWQIVVQPKNSGEPTSSGNLISSNTYTADQLTHATQYEYYVRAYCSSTQQSNWVGPYYFTTLCAVFETPFYENFNDDDASTHKSCWSFVDANGDGAQWNMNATVPSIQGNPWFGTPEFDDWMISPAINVNGAKALKFDYRAAFSPFFGAPRFGVEVLMSTTDTDPASFSVIMPLMEFTNTEYLEKTVYVTANGPVYFAFRVPPTFSTAGGTSILQIDNVAVVDAPACPAPEALKATSITQTSAVLSWKKGFQETQWNVVVQPAGSGIPTGTGILTSNNTAFPSGTLLANTKYEYYVRAYCNGTDQSAWVGPFVFTTLCNAFPTPFIETFENNSLSEGCWRITNGNSDSFAWNLNVTLNPYEGIQSAGIFTGSNGKNNDWLISPTVTITAGQRLRYYYRVYSSDFWEDLDVKLSTNGIELDQFTTTLYTVDYFDEPPLNNTVWKEKVINFPAGVTGDVNVAWHIPQKDPNPWNYRGQMLVIDKVIIEDIPVCPAPVNLAVQNITDVAAQISWEATGTEASWNVYVQPAGLPAPVGNGDSQYLHTATASPYTVTGLTPAIQYDYYVRAVCDGSTNSEWIGPLKFITSCSFENLCEYTITLSGGPTMGVGGGIDLIQNGVKLQTMEFATSAWNEVPAPADYLVFLCTGVEFSLFWDAVGTAPGQFPGAMVEVKDGEGNVVWTGDLGVIAPRSTFYTGLSLCGAITCPQPTDLAVSGTSVFSWTAGGTETQWEVAVQPVANGTLPQSGIIVTTNSYTPQASDFVNLQAGTYEFFVRAICGGGDSSFWSGPYEFVRNDDSSKAIQVPVNSGEACEQSVTTISFAGATPSAETMTCTGTNYGDVWVEFVAASKVHTIELGNFSAKNIYQGGTGQEPKVGLTLYKVVGTTLQEVTCSNNNVILAAYSTELEVGATYKVRLTLNNDMPYSTLDLCVTTPLDACKLDIPNGGFEKPEANLGLGNFFSQNVVPGWRNNLLESDTSLYETIFLQEAFGLSGFTPYEGGQAIQLMVPDDSIALPPDPNDMVNIRGMYQDIDSSEITKFDYSFAHLAGGHTIQLYAGPPSGPFVPLEEHVGVLTWNFYEGTYNVPAGQNVTRFIFRSKDMAIGNMLDAISIVANTGIITQAHTLDCVTASTTLEAEGKGTWVADASNPGTVVIAQPDSKTTAVSEFTTPGEYTFYWRTRYCEYTVVITKQGVDVTPQVTTPVTYCQDAEAVPLTASDLQGYSHMWYTQATGGTALDAVPTPDTATAGTTSYYVAYASADGCEGARAQIDVIVNEKTIAVTNFTYDAESYCEGAQNPVITLDAEFTANGIFTAAPEGLNLNAATGAIDLSASAAGTYEVTYTIQPDAATCNEGGVHTVSVIVSGNLDSVISQECRDNSVWLVAASKDGSFDPDVHFTWKNEAGETVGDDRPDFNVTEYITLEGDLEVPLNFTVTVSSGSCAADSGYTVTSLMCEVPRGISPNGDGYNDTLNLTGLGVKNITIFNRYGKKVYSHGSTYTNQWHGQDTNENELPDGTYFYSIEKTDGSSTTGWIYINRQY